MSVNGTIQLAYQDTAWFAANPTIVLLEGQHVYLSDGVDEFLSAYVVGDGVTELQDLPWKGLSSNQTQLLSPDGNTNISAFDGQANIGVTDGVNSSSAVVNPESIDFTSVSVTKNGSEIATLNDLVNNDTITCQFTATNFADNTSYFCGTLIAPASSTSNDRRRFRFPFTGTITKIFFTNGITVATSSQDCVLKINNITQATSTTVGNIRFDNTTVTADFTGLSIAGNANDNCEVEVAVPNLTTNGSGCVSSFQITFQES